jgi:hypothetical protein
VKSFQGNAGNAQDRGIFYRREGKHESLTTDYADNTDRAQKIKGFRQKDKGKNIKAKNAGIS